MPANERKCRATAHRTISYTRCPKKSSARENINNSVQDDDTNMSLYYGIQNLKHTSINTYIKKPKKKLKNKRAQ